MKKNGLIMMMVLANLNLWGQRNNILSLDDKQMSRMKTELALTDEQVAQLQDIDKKFQDERMILQADTALSAEYAAIEKTRILKERNAGIKNVLTKDQLSKWMEMMKTQSRRRAGARPGSRENLEELKTAVGLSNEQAEGVTIINAHMNNEFRKLRSDTVISSQNRRGELKKIMDDRNTRIKKILTNEQYAKFLDYEAKTNSTQRRGPRNLKNK